MARKLNRGLAVAASAAIAAVYAAGVVATRAEPRSAVHTPAAARVTAATTAPVDIPTQIARAIASATATVAPTVHTAPTTPAAPVASAVRFRDGTFSGTGTSRRGNIAVALTIDGGQITDVKITRSTTYYPISDISRLPGQVVSRQSAAVDVVSGASESSKAFRGAVSQALAQAGATSLVPTALRSERVPA